MRNILKKISEYIPSPVGRARVGVLFLLLPFTFYAQTNTFPTSGNVGIGTTNPLDKLQIGEGITFHSGGHKVIGFSYAPSGAVDLDETAYSGEIRFDPGQGELMLGVSSSITSKPSTRIIMRKDGNVGIGTTNPGTWKLAVNGNIRAKEIKVETGWSDFVFEDNYNLPTLEEVEQHIKEKGHLKDIPSAKEVEANGIFLGEMNAKLLQKIEELMLYTIKQEKRILQLEEEIETLKAIVK
ncbi:hypothetical protein [Sinomicrobium sp. M5D2P17]